MGRVCAAADIAKSTTLHKLDMATHRDSAHVSSVYPGKHLSANSRRRRLRRPSVRWLADQLVEDLPGERIAVYAGSGRSGIYEDSAFRRCEREDISKPFVAASFDSCSGPKPKRGQFQLRVPPQHFLIDRVHVNPPE